MLSAAGFPVSLPFTLILERDTALEEIVTVNTISGTNITSCTRGVDGTSAVAHSGGAAVEHGVSARDFTEPQAHIAASSAVHGLTGSVVGTSDTQVLTSKTLTAPTISSPVFNGTATGSLTNLALTTPVVTGSGGALTLPAGPDTLVGRATTDTLTNKTLTTPTINGAVGGAASFTGATLDATSTHGGVSGTTLAADRAAWTTYTPTFTNCTSPVGAFAYKLIGKTMFLRWDFTSGTANGVGPVAFTLPTGTAAVRYELPTYAPSSTVTPYPTWQLNAGASQLTSDPITAGRALSDYVGRGFAVIEIA